ncbi:EH_Signature domain-containing protein [Nitrosospira multiformis]|uniref:EH_Signature domain-containing protein n=1 Tax=Nitrosospira multiformis TaxID=1231 RepID=A0A1H9YDR9_9PROT|nr:EH signature domain-containing protein [Nitrosospira multiformis]SES66994.1 EH_Signature domain-containing protein [Nitrosospira multiformis]
MLTLPSIELLTHQLKAAIASIDFSAEGLGMSQLVEKACAESERLFQGYAKAKPSKQDAYAAALAFMRGQQLDIRQLDMIASALSEPIREQGGGRPLGHQRLPSLLKHYEAEAEKGNLWRLTWYGLLSSYFSFEPQRALDAELLGWEQLRSLLHKTWPLVDKHAGGNLVPDWIAVMRREPQLLTNQPTDKYAQDFLQGQTEAVERFVTDLGIPQTSWFWHTLVLSAVGTATRASDNAFSNHIPRLIQLIEERPVFRDEAIEKILIRYHKSAVTPVHERLKDYVIRKDVWRNPKLKAAGIATAWNRVPDPVWQMVLEWVNERSLRDFFDILAARNGADEGRLSFWSKYLKQITWTRLIFSSDTLILARQQQSIRDLIAREEGSYATLTSKRDVDAFMMQIGKYIVIEFSKKPNACYVYSLESLKFDRNARRYSGTTDDLAYGFHGGAEARIIHRNGWQNQARYELEALGIRPDTLATRHAGDNVQHPGSAQTLRGNYSEASLSYGTSRSPRREPPGTPFSMNELERLVARYRDARIKDRRGVSGGRLWVEDPSQHSTLATQLQAYGFRWGNARAAWYYPES